MAVTQTATVAGRRGATDRFLTTVLMTDIVGSTEHASELGDSAWRELIQVHHALVRRALKQHGGREVDTAGDGFFATFDAPADAIASALDIINRVRDLGIEIRAGAHVGEVEQIGAKVGGITVPIASRIMAEAGPGELLVSSTIRDLAAGAGLRFEDRGSRTLKGVQGEWHVYAVSRADDTAGSARAIQDLSTRRAAAVRRARSRPIWQRQPRAAAAAVVALAVIVATAGLLAWQPWLKPALTAITDDSVGLIEGGRNAITASIKVGDRPGGVVASDGYLWVTNTGSDTVSQIDPATGTVIRIIDVGHGPAGIAAADGTIWVANSGERTVSRINAASARAVNPVTVGNGPTAVAAGNGSVWVANTGDSTIQRIDPASGAAGERIPVAAVPIAVAVGESGVWIASADGAVITHVDPATGVTLAAPIPLASRPVGLALTTNALWVASSDGSVTRIDPATTRIIDTLDVGGSPTAIAATETFVWVADGQGSVSRLSATDTSLEPTRIQTTSSPGALTVSGSDVWVATRAAPQSHRGGTLRVVNWYPPDLDPLGFPVVNMATLEADGLVGYRHVGGIAGSVLLPDLATAIPNPTDGGRTYLFHLRPGLEYSTGEPVRPQDFRRAIERVFQAGPVSAIGWGYLYPAIIGADLCAENDGAPCDLSSGIVTDDAANTIIFNLSEPDPDFLFKLAIPTAYPVREGVPMDALVQGTFPGTGPYVVDSVTETEVRLVRNPNFQVWDAEVRPDGYADAISFTSGIDAGEQVAMIERGDADLMPLRGDNRIGPELFADLRARRTGQLHFASASVVAAFMNASLPPFDNAAVRQAVNMAIDRAHVADLFGGPLAVQITCQVLPPGWLGYEPYCPYTTHPDPGGRWQAPNLDAARQLVQGSGTQGAAVVVGPVRARYAELRDYLLTILLELGYEATTDTQTDDEYVFSKLDEGRIQLSVFEWNAGFLAPSEFLGIFTCFQGDAAINYCDESFDERFIEARQLQTTDMAAASAKWAALDREVVDLGLWAPLYNEGTDFVSERVGNYQFNPSYNVLFDQLWVQ